MYRILIRKLLGKINLEDTEGYRGMEWACDLRLGVTIRNERDWLNPVSALKENCDGSQLVASQQGTF